MEIDPLKVKSLSVERWAMANKRLPDALMKFSNLEELDLGPIKESGHESYSDFSGVYYHKYFDRYYLHKLKKLPGWLFSLENLRYLSVGVGNKRKPEKMLASISKLTRLRKLDIEIEFLTAETISSFFALTQLKEINLGILKPDEKTESYIEEIKKSLSGCEIRWYHPDLPNLIFMLYRGKERIGPLAG